MKPRPVEQIIKDMEAMGTSPKTIDQTIKNLSNHITAQLENMKGVTAVGDNVKLTLRQARMNSGMSLEEVEQETGYSVKRIMWHEDNSGEVLPDEAVLYCKTYGVSFTEIYFMSEEKGIQREKECKGEQPTARYLCALSEIEAKLTAMILYITDDTIYTDAHIISSILEVIDEIGCEQSILKNELTESIEKIRNKNRLNNTLAGR